MRLDLERYAASAARLDLAGIDMDAFRERPLDAATLRCLRYMHDIEHHTVCYLRDLLVTPVHRDPAATTFLTVWNYEEMWHGDAIARVLAAHGEDAGAAACAGCASTWACVTASRPRCTQSAPRWPARRSGRST